MRIIGNTVRNQTMKTEKTEISHRKTFEINNNFKYSTENCLHRGNLAELFCFGLICNRTLAEFENRIPRRALTLHRTSIKLQRNFRIKP